MPGRRNALGVFTYPIEIRSLDGRLSERFEALVDTGATFTVAPASVLMRLGVKARRKVKVRFANGVVVDRDLGDAPVRINDATIPTIVIFGDEAAPVLLGAYTLEAALLAVDPVNKRLIPTEALLMASVVSRKCRHAPNAL